MSDIIAVNNVSKTFIDEGRRPLPVLKEVTFSVKQGDFFVLLGPSGCGKSTLLRIMSGLEKQYDGEIMLGENISQRDFSFIFQQFALLPWLTVYQNVEIALLSLKLSPAEKKRRISREIEKIGLSKSTDLYPKELSGGMKQRVGIARALVRNPQIIFMDEPFSSLDSFTAKELRQEVLDLWQAEKRTIIMVTHNIEEAVEMADRIAVMSQRPGKIERIVENNLSRPRQNRSADFFNLEDILYGLVKIMA